MWPGQGAHAAHRMSVPWPLSVGVIAIIIITFSQFPPSPHSQPVITLNLATAQPGQSSHLCKSDPSSDEPLTEETQGWRPGCDV